MQKCKKKIKKNGGGGVEKQKQDNISSLKILGDSVIHIQRKVLQI